MADNTDQWSTMKNRQNDGVGHPSCYPSRLTAAASGGVSDRGGGTAPASRPLPAGIDFQSNLITEALTELSSRWRRPTLRRPRNAVEFIPHTTIVPVTNNNTAEALEHFPFSE
ncbi:hypothetical protein EVAR_29792_1 [Eumeta japonica]|uniref:Uncharacterized protein n=1 Tax=Eumeta variegata TaxID=151549 RepID=A0A4C1XNR6_EUMVA|nr:hypothetical protein EVAR_29792_1 [Eumeta japonica]